MTATRTGLALVATICLLTVLSHASPAAATIIQPVGVTSTIAGDAGSDVLYLIQDNPGFAAAALQRPTGTGVLLPTGESLANALATVHERSGTAHAESWTRDTSVGNPVFSFDLGTDVSIDSVLLWQYGNSSPGNSTRDFEVIFHTLSEGPVFSFASGGGSEATEFAGTMSAALPGTTANNVAQQFSFPSATARFVGLRIANNYNGIEGPGGTRFGLGEVRFDGTPSSLPTMNLSLGKPYAYSVLPMFSGGTFYFDDPHVQTPGVFSTGDLTDGAVMPNSSPTVPVVSTIVGWGNPVNIATDITFDLGEPFQIDTVRIGTHTWSPFANGAPDGVQILGSLDGTSFFLITGANFTAADVVGDGHHDLNVAVAGDIAQYVRLRFDGGAVLNGNTPNKWMLDEVTIFGRDLPPVPEPATLSLLGVGLLGLLRRRRAA